MGLYWATLKVSLYYRFETSTILLDQTEVSCIWHFRFSPSPISLSSVFGLRSSGNGRPIPIRCRCFNDSDSSPARDSGVAPLLFLLLLRTDLLLSVSLYLHVYSIQPLISSVPPCKISDIERILRCSPSPRRRSNIAWLIKAPGSVRRISVSHSDRCTCFHLDLLFTQFVQIQGALLLKG